MEDGMQAVLKRQTVIFTVLFFVLSMSGMLVYAKNKVITVEDVAQEQMSYTQKDDTGSKEEINTDNRLKIEVNEEKEYLSIPLAQSVKAENITMENHYMEQELWIYIQETEKGFYDEQVIEGNTSGITAGTYEYHNGTYMLKFQMQDIYECRNVLKENQLHLSFEKPKAVFDKIVVIDPGEGGDASGYVGYGLKEKEITLDIAKRVKLKLDKTDIKAYFTRLEDSNPTGEKRIQLANTIGADMFISIHTNANEGDATVYGTETVYSSQFFIPEFGSVALADMLEREVVTSISGRGNGLIAAVSEDVVIWEAKVPAALIRTGYLTNKQEAALLAREDYRERIADGIYNAIMKAYEQKEQGNED